MFDLSQQWLIFNIRVINGEVRKSLQGKEFNTELADLYERYNEIKDRPTEFPDGELEIVSINPEAKEKLEVITDSLKDSYLRSQSKAEKLGLLRFALFIRVAEEHSQISFGALDEVFGFGEGNKKTIEEKAVYSTHREIILGIIERLNDEA